MSLICELGQAFLCVYIVLSKIWHSNSIYSQGVLRIKLDHIGKMILGNLMEDNFKSSE